MRERKGEEERKDQYLKYSKWQVDSSQKETKTEEEEKEPKKEEKEVKSIDCSTEQVRLINFRLNKGDGMDFKRHFLSIKEALKKMIVRI